MSFKFLTVTIKVLFQKLKLALMLQCVNMLRYEQKIIRAKGTAAGFECIDISSNTCLCIRELCMLCCFSLDLLERACVRACPHHAEAATDTWLHIAAPKSSNFTQLTGDLNGFVEQQAEVTLVC